MEGHIDRFEYEHLFTQEYHIPRGQRGEYDTRG
jgi:hypothetical protein